MVNVSTILLLFLQLHPCVPQSVGCLLSWSLSLRKKIDFLNLDSYAQKLLFRAEVDMGERPELRTKGNVEMAIDKCERQVLTGRSDAVKPHHKTIKWGPQMSPWKIQGCLVVKLTRGPGQVDACCSESSCWATPCPA